jgi:L-methionine (R)-S-oxide reductase
VQDLSERAAKIRREGSYRWVGIYEVTDEEIAILGWDGPSAPAYPRFPRTQGLCGAAVESGEPVVVGDVASDARYLTTFGSTRSEIVVPILRAGTVVGVLDVESDQANAFGDEDRAHLEVAASSLATEWDA